ncbi:hypothetical protein NEICINOT_04072 [Neisseria cinerea ATCC 14685]|uniref:Uncharacterized protein n=1 Tax=Neisseria cinerea ATCC 14685 TaxID=546262 RepID=D0W337_NEICI|nr:hypothetical protein NEICINOT_04072 [Neisseria cinerea ATCC 14685]
MPSERGSDGILFFTTCFPEWQRHLTTIRQPAPCLTYKPIFPPNRTCKQKCRLKEVQTA